MLRLATLFSTAAIFASTATAHFTLDFPPTRGFDEDTEPDFRGGFQLTNRSLFPLSGGQIQIASHHATSQFVTLISFDQDPESLAQFNQTSSGQSVPFLKPFIKLTGTGELCYPVDIASLGIPGVAEGTNATIQVQFNGGDGELYQCADVTLTWQAVTIPSCTNTTVVTGVQEVSSSASAAASTVASASATGSAVSASGTTTPANSGVLSDRLEPVAALAVAAALAASILL